MAASAAPRPPRRKRFGQHFLHDPAIIARMLEALDARAGDHLVEIGPGPGALTK
jgi:16S rRNA (adenine1518-N6/adenine1519-N6)-dimethyltransferase